MLTKQARYSKYFWWWLSICCLANFFGPVICSNKVFKTDQTSKSEVLQIFVAKTNNTHFVVLYSETTKLVPEVGFGQFLVGTVLYSAAIDLTNKGDVLKIFVVKTFDCAILHLWHTFCVLLQQSIQNLPLEQTKVRSSKAFHLCCYHCH